MNSEMVEKKYPCTPPRRILVVRLNFAHSIILCWAARRGGEVPRFFDFEFFLVKKSLYSPSDGGVKLIIILSVANYA